MTATVRIALAVLLAPAATIGLPAAGHAALPPAAAPRPSGDFTWAVQPAGPKGPTGRDYFVYSAAPGQKIKDQVAISNLGEVPLTFRVYATDAFNTVDGSFALLTADRKATDVGTWAAFRAGTHTVKPGKRVTVPFTLTVPENATPGDHSGGVIAAVTQQQTSTQGQRVNVDRRVAARVYLRVNGPLTPSLQVTSLKTDYSGSPVGSGDMKLTYQIRNTGNVRVKAAAKLAAAGPFGWPLGRGVSRPIPELLPGNSYTFTERVRGVLPAGPLTASVKLSPADPGSGTPLPGRPVTRTASAWAVPWLPLAALAVLIAAGFALRRRGHGRTGVPAGARP